MEPFQRVSIEHRLSELLPPDRVSEKFGLEAWTWDRYIGRPGMPWASGTLFLEKHPDLKPPQARGIGSNPGVFWELRNIPQVRSSLGRPIRTLSEVPFRLEKATLPEHATPTDQEILERQHRYCSQVFWEWCESGALSRFIREVLWTAPICGFYWGEIVAHKGTFEGLDTWIPDVPEWRAPWTVRYWITQREQLEGVLADFSASWDFEGGPSPSTVPIPRSKFIHVASEQIGSNFEGDSWLRPAYNQLLQLKQAYQILGLAVEVYGIGELWFKVGEQGLDKDSETELTDYLENRKASLVPGGILPPGVEPHYGSPAQTMPDLAPVFATLERAVAMVLDSEDRIMALTEAGSYAARKTASEDARKAYSSIVGQYVVRPLRELLRRFIAVNWPEDAAQGKVYLPRIKFGQVSERDPSEYVKQIVMAIQSGALDRPDTGPVIRELLGIDAIPTGPQPGPTPVTPGSPGEGEDDTVGGSVSGTGLYLPEQTNPTGSPIASGNGPRVRTVDERGIQPPGATRTQ